MFHVACFDVFDTILTRAVGSPETVFLLLGRWLYQESLIACTPEAFARARVDAEKRAHQNTGAYCTIDSIYAELSVALKLSKIECARLKELECAVEQEIIRPVPGAFERIEQARALGQRVVFLSDMYISSEFIRQQLIRYGMWRDEDRCYTSCERGKSKRSGALFADMLVNESAVPHVTVHHGNSVEYDIKPAARTGLHVVPLLEANLNRYEDLLQKQAWASEGLTSVMAGASRLARLKTLAGSTEEAALRDVAAGVVAPTLVGFVLWILDRAQQRGLKRLYFISRDGQILLKIARRLARILDLSLEMRYLYGSRQAWNLPAITRGSDQELAWIWDRTDFLSTESLLARIGIEPEEVRQYLHGAGLRREDWNRNLSATERSTLKHLFQASDMRMLILNRAKQKRQVLLQYLDKQGVLDSISWGLVDLGWFGSMQNALSAVLAEAGKTVPVGFYFALWKGEIADECAANREAYYFDERLGLGFIDRVPDLIALIEMFCAADHGTVIDFVERDGDIQAVLKEMRNQKVIDWGLPLVRQTVVCFIDNLLLHSRHVNPWADVREAISDVLRAFWLKPSAVEAKAWASFPWEDGLGKQTYCNQLAKSFNWKDVARIVYSGRVEPHHRAYWFAGSVALSPLEIRVAVTSLDSISRALRRVRHRVRLRLREMVQILTQRLRIA